MAKANDIKERSGTAGAVAKRPGRELLRMRIASAGEPIFKARARLGEMARRLGFDSDTVDGILLAVSEALTNALIYGHTTARKCVRLHAWVENSRLVVEVQDHGQGFHPDHVQLPPPECYCEGGRGLYLMSVFMDEVDWVPTPHGTTVRMAKCCVSPILAEASRPAPGFPMPATS